MKIWYQSYTRIGFDPRWKSYEDDLNAYVQKVARPGTRVDVHGVQKMAPKMFESDYIQQMHVAQVIDNALQAEREGYDAFCVGGTLDLGHVSLREVLDIPVAFIAESSFYAACLLARKFAIVGQGEKSLRRKLELVTYHGLEQRCVPGAHMNSNNLEIIDLLGQDPQRFIDMFTEASRKCIAAGAGVLIPGFGAIGSFLGQRGIHDIDGIPILDIVAVVIKTAEMLVDLKNLGLKRTRQGMYSYVSKEELLAARKIYGVEPASLT